MASSPPVSATGCTNPVGLATFLAEIDRNTDVVDLAQAAALVKIGEAGSKLVVTVDCGAQAFEALAMARDAGVDVVVVDD